PPSTHFSTSTSCFSHHSPPPPHLPSFPTRRSSDLTELLHARADLLPPNVNPNLFVSALVVMVCNHSAGLHVDIGTFDGITHEVEVGKSRHGRIDGSRKRNLE